MSSELNTFLERLRESQDWPGTYLFKFVVKFGSESESAILSLLQGADISTRPSRGNKYVSISATMRMDSPEDVIRIYEQVQKLEGVISL